jgi:DNA-directed RNA polymerase sigma subunit (sigma70/sigma32)
MAITERKMRALRLRVTPMSYDDVAADMGITRTRANALAIAAMRWLRHPNNREHPERWMADMVEGVRWKRGI